MISAIIFFILSQAPGGPLTPYLQNPHITAADIARLKHNFGLDRPLYVQYFGWLGSVLRGDLGYSTSNSEPVAQAIFERLPATLVLMGTSIGLSLIVGIVFGLYAAIKPYSVQDYIITTFAFFGQSMPVFWLALMMQLAFAVVGITAFGYHFALPSAGISSSDDFDLGDRIQHLILPVLVLSFLSIATWSRFMRSSMLEVIKTDYMRTATAKGTCRDRQSHPAPRSQEYADSRRDDRSALRSRTRERCGRHRNDLRLAGNGPALLQRARPIRLCAPDGLFGPDFVPGRLVQSHRRHRVRVARPAREVRLRTH